MTFTISLGWWLAPSIVTLLAWAAVMNDKNPYTFHITFGLGTIASVFAWFIWAVLK